MASKTQDNELEKPKSKGAGSYNSYLKVVKLKELQVCLSDPAQHDEPLFIIIHQAYELWFKLILHELDTIIPLVKKQKVYKANFYMRRVNTILRLLVQQIHILETMPSKDFLGFRNHLNPASGFQSAQFREIEFSGGLKDKRMLEVFKEDPVAYMELMVRFNAPSLKDVFFEMLRSKGFDLPEILDTSNEAEVKQKDEQCLKELSKIYSNQEEYSELYELCESLVDFDELIFLWRTHHVTVVERVIGFKRGTGGSEGVGYLRSTLDKRCFPELWAVKTYIQP